MCERVPKNVTLGGLKGHGLPVAAKCPKQPCSVDTPRKVVNAACNKPTATIKDADAEVVDNLQKTIEDVTVETVAAPDDAADVLSKTPRLAGGGVTTRTPNSKTAASAPTGIPVRIGAGVRGLGVGGIAMRNSAPGLGAGFVAGARINRSPAGIRDKIDKPGVVGNKISPKKSLSALDVTGLKAPGLLERSATHGVIERSPCDASPAVKALTVAKSLKNDKITASALKQESVARKHKYQIFQKELSNLQKQQSIFMGHCEQMDHRIIDMTEKQYKFIAMILTDQCKIIVNDDDLLRLPKKIPIESVNDLKERIHMTFGQITQFLCDEMDKLECRAQFANLHTSLIERKDQLLAGLIDYVGVLCKECQSKIDGQAARALEELSRLRRKYADLEADLLKEQGRHGQIENELEIKHKEKINEELLRREACVAEHNARYAALQQKVNDLQQQLTVKTCEHDNLAKQLTQLQAENDNLKASVEKQRMIENDLGANLIKSKDELQQRLIQIECLKKELALNMNLRNEYESRPPMDELKSKDAIIMGLQGEAKVLEITKLSLIDQIKDLSKRCDNYTEMKQRLRDSQAIVADLTAKVTKLSKKLEESEKKRISEMESLKKELEEAKQLNERLETQIERQQDILQVRSEMIAKLQTDEKHANKKIAETKTEINEKNNLLKQLENELATAKADFKNLFTSFGAQQIEISHLKRVIQLMEEGNDRAQMLRVQQEQRIADGDDEIDELKETMEKRQYLKKTLLKHMTKEELRRAIEEIDNKKKKSNDKKNEKDKKKKK